MSNSNDEMKRALKEYISKLGLRPTRMVKDSDGLFYLELMTDDPTDYSFNEVGETTKVTFTTSTGIVLDKPNSKAAGFDAFGEPVEVDFIDPCEDCPDGKGQYCFPCGLPGVLIGNRSK